MLVTRTPEGAAASEADDVVTELYGTEYCSLVRLAALLVGSAAAAEEIARDAFVALHGAWPRLRDRDAAASFLLRSVVRRSRLGGRGLRGLPGQWGGAGFVGQGEGPEAGPRVMAALLALPGRQREAVVLKFYLDLPDSRSAAAMGVALPAMRDHAARGVTALTHIL
jgi:DNA-directed RNA polymerase specialized sigma24 family protein